MSSKQASSSTAGAKRGGYLAGSKTPSEVKPPPPAFAQPKTNAKPAK